MYIFYNLIVWKIIVTFSSKIFLNKLLPTLLQLLMLCGVLDQTVPVCWTVPGMQIWQPNVLNILGWKFSPFCSLLTVMCFYKYCSWTLFTVGPLLFPFVWGKFLHICGCSVPFFIVFSAVSSLYGFSWVVHLSKCTKVISQPTVLELCLDLFSQFSITGCKVLFHQVLILDTFYSGP